MKYKIKECVIYGVKSPFMFFGGWVEQSAQTILVKCNNKILFELELPQTKSKIKSFNIKTNLRMPLLQSDLYFYAVDKENHQELIHEYHSSFYDRLMKKMTPAWAYKNKNGSYDYTKELNSTLQATDALSYNKWINKYEKFSPVDDYSYNPLISLVIPVYNVSGKYLAKCLDSILAQTYQNFEICIADDCSTNEDTLNTLKKYEKKDSRIKVKYREKNGHISEATNSALELASGEFIALMDNDDALMPQALNEVVRVLNENPELDFVYSDEDKFDMSDRRSDPHFKADFAKDTFYGGNYICHFSVIRKTIIEKVGGFRKGYEGAQDFDLFLRISEITDKFYHISKILYHWRMIPGSTALDSKSKNYAGEAGKRALEDLFKKKNINANVNIMVNTHYFVEYLLDESPKVDIIIHANQMSDDLISNLKEMEIELSESKVHFVIFTEDELLEICLKNDFDKNKYEVISTKGQNPISIINKYCMNNANEYIIFLDENSKIITFDALDVMAGYANREDTGAVGTRVIDTNGWTMDAGYFLVNNHILHIGRPSFIGDFGVYGNLLVPFNYRLIEWQCFMIKKDRFIQMNGLNDTLNYKQTCFDLFIRLNSSYNNVIVPHVEVVCNKYQDINSQEEKELIQLWKDSFIDVTYDKYYNINFSDQAAHRLDK